MKCQKKEDTGTQLQTTLFKKGGIIMKKFTNSATFDVNYLFGEAPENHKRAHKENHHNEAVFDVKNIFEK